MYSELHCRLYIDSDASLDSLRSEFGIWLNESCFRSDFKKLVHVSAPYKNVHHDARRLTKQGDISCTRYTAEFEPTDVETIDQHMYIEGVCDLILTLRRKGMVVAASCAFEDAVARITGWNWRSDSTQQPSEA